MVADQALWQKSLQELGIATPDALAEWARIKAAHSAPGRHYHTLDHLSAMFATLNKLAPPDLPLVRLAVWFHDLVYDVGRSDNEKQSAEIAIKFASSNGLEAQSIDKISRLIRSTAQHEPLWDHPACDALLDADLAVLATDADVYDDYAAAIRREYAIFPDEVYGPGRRSVLTRFLERKQLYFTECIRVEWDERARTNLQRELAWLGAAD